MNPVPPLSRARMPRSLWIPFLILLFGPPIALGVNSEPDPVQPLVVVEDASVDTTSHTSAAFP